MRVGPPRKLSAKNWCFWTVVLEKNPESPLDSKEINPKGKQLWIFIGRIDAEAEALILWPPDAKSPLTGKDSDAGKDWRQDDKGATEDEMLEWHHRLNGHEFDQTLGDRGAWCAAIHGVAKSRTKLIDWTTTTLSSGGEILSRCVHKMCKPLGEHQLEPIG